MECQPVRVEIVFHGGGAGFPLEFIYQVDWNSKANKDYFSYEYVIREPCISNAVTDA